MPTPLQNTETQMHLAKKTEKSRTVIIYFNKRIVREVNRDYNVSGAVIPGDLVVIVRTDDDGYGYYSSLILQPDAIIDRELVVATNTKEECIRVNYPGRPHSNRVGWTWTLIPVTIIDRIEIKEANLTTLTPAHGLSWDYVKKEHSRHGERGPCAHEGCETEPCPTYRKQIKNT